MPSPTRGRWHGEAVTDEVEAPRFATLATSSVCSASLRSQLPLIGEALGMRGSKASLVRGSLFRCGGAKKTEIVLAFLRGMCYNNNENHY